MTKIVDLAGEWMAARAVEPVDEADDTEIARLSDRADAVLDRLARVKATDAADLAVKVLVYGQDTDSLAGMRLGKSLLRDAARLAPDVARMLGSTVPEAVPA